MTKNSERASTRLKQLHRVPAGNSAVTASTRIGNYDTAIVENDREYVTTLSCYIVEIVIHLTSQAHDSQR